MVAALPLSAYAAGDADRIKELERKLERSMQLIEDLSAKVRKPETNKDQDKAVSMDSKQIERMDTLERQVTQISAGSGQRKADGVPLHGFKMDVNDDLGSKTDVRMTGFYGTYITDGWELLSEYYHFNNRGITPGGSNKRSNAWFAQVGTNFNGLIDDRYSEARLQWAVWF